MSSATNHLWPTSHPHSRSPADPYGAPSRDSIDPTASTSRTPNFAMDGSMMAESGNINTGSDATGEDDPRVALFKDLFTRSEAQIASLFTDDEENTVTVDATDNNAPPQGLNGEKKAPDAAPRKKARTIDEDDYDDSDDDEEDAENDNSSPLKAKSNGVPAPLQSKPPSAPLSKSVVPSKPPSSSPKEEKSSEEVRKKLEHDKKAAEDAAIRSFHTMFYTLEHDRDAMLDQQKLEESERQVDAEMSGSNANSGAAGNNTSGQGSLSSANLGASSLTLKHLIARIDAKRDQVRASDAELRSLMSEVRKNRSKWASEEKVGQEELYESAEKVLSELKAMTEHSTAFLSRVNKREAPDYYNVIKHPMDLGTMTKKLKGIQYKSKKEFVNDINLIWANCLKYNANPEHFLRKHALYMRKETEKLVPLIPDIVIRDRAEVEAEERRLQNGDAELDGGEESDDEPIMSSRGRKAPGKKTKKGASTSRKAMSSSGPEGTPGAETKPSLNSLSTNASGIIIRNDFLQLDSDAQMEGSQNGLSTPPPGGTGSITPAGLNGIPGSALTGSQSDLMEVDGLGSSINGVGPAGQGQGEDSEDDDLEYKTWKQVTKKDRALVTAERHRLFTGDQLNTEEPALLRTKAGMRRWLRKQREALAEGAAGDRKKGLEEKEVEGEAAGKETLAEGMEGEEERVLPDYYDTLAAIPELADRMRWVEDSSGHVDPPEEFLRMVPKAYFTSPESALTERMEANMRQMQETRKVCTKIGIVKQMQLQSQMYQNQFQKYDPEPFVEQDIEPHVVSDDGPIMAPWVCRAALQRSVGKIFYHAGFEEFQPSALDAVTDIASDFFAKLVRTLGVYHEAPKVPVPVTERVEGASSAWKERFTPEEIILHCLHENGVDVESLESYIKDDVERLSSKLGVMHDRMKAHLADLLRPALNDAGPDGANAFNDGSEQFVGGDFAEDIDEDFFGFKELGLDKEFGMASLSVPLHLLQNRMHSAYTAQNTSSATTSTSAFTPPPAYEPVTREYIKDQIGLVQNFFLAKLHANNDEPLVEDDELPQKQRLPKPRLPPTGKISSPRKRPFKDHGGAAGGVKKKKKIDGGFSGAASTNVKDEENSSKATHGFGNATGAKTNGNNPASSSKPKLNFPGPVLMERVESGKDSEADKDDGGSSAVGMMSPESIVAA
ncbi:MAG: hypothetical protein M1819_006083 [Sarea resinae]|nr:MAG: hypothetical protein M1819_006083 [Sarea resinae]